MKSTVSRLGAVKRFLANDNGSATVEAVLWLPMFAMLLGLFADVSMIFNNQSRIMRVVQDANRDFSIGRLTSTGETENFVKTELDSLSPNARVHSSVIAGRVSTTVSLPVRDMQVVGIAGIFQATIMTVRADHVLEY